MRGKKKNKKKSIVYSLKSIGFTLIELLIAVTIFSIVASVLYSSFRLGIMSWRRVEVNLSRYQQIRCAINRFTEDVTNAFMYKNIPFKGEEKQIEFAAFIKDKDTKKGNIGKISYTFLRSATSDALGALLRRQLPYWQAIEKEGAVEEEKGSMDGAEELLSGVIDFSISYCYKSSRETEEADLEWLPEWEDEEAIPAGVKIELVLKDDYTPGGKKVFAKRICIPVGKIGSLEEL